MKEVRGETVNNKNNKHNQYTGSGDITAVSSYTFSYDVDTSSGNSGGPVYVEETIGGHTYYSALGIHTRGGNSGTRITPDVMKFFMSNSNIGY